jgi:hypothetical protein
MARFPLVITRSGTRIPTSRNRKPTRKPRERPHRHPRASRLGYQSLIAAARSRDCDPLTYRNAVT